MQSRSPTIYGPCRRLPNNPRAATRTFPIIFGTRLVRRHKGNILQLVLGIREAQHMASQASI